MHRQSRDDVRLRCLSRRRGAVREEQWRDVYLLPYGAVEANVAKRVSRSLDSVLLAGVGTALHLMSLERLT